MSLLDSAPGFEPVTVFPEETYLDADGNTMTHASSTGIPAKARWQLNYQSGTASRRAEQQDEGFATEQVYEIRFPRGFQILGSQAKVRRESDGRTYSIFGDVQVYNGSRRTAHATYTVRIS